ncbi:UbiA family prenyltransferase [Candidatus Bathyarchaeota archaeon]|nr:UbiA family prenyltransferase [Candidatus Bathyarchaeota archaeon]
MRKVAGLIRLMRPINCSMMGLAVIVGAIISARDLAVVNDSLSGLMLGFITAFTLTGASMAINDYYDRDIDAINEPNRPIPSGLIKPMESLFFASALTFTGLASAAFTHIPCLLTAIASWIISATYSTVGKRTGLPGNFLVSTCISVPFIYGGLVLKSLVDLNIVFFAALAFLANTGREITKGIADVEGDKIRGVRTLAISHGARAAAYASSAFFILAVLLSPIPAILGLMHIWFLPPLILADIGFTWSSLSLIREHTRENAKRIKKITLIWMMLSLVAFIAGTIK